MRIDEIFGWSKREKAVAQAQQDYDDTFEPEYQLSQELERVRQEIKKLVPGPDDEEIKELKARIPILKQAIKDAQKRMNDAFDRYVELTGKNPK